MATSSSSISFGSIVTTNGTTRLSGTNSELDTDSLIEALVAAKNLPADRLQTKIDTNTTKITAISDMQAILEKIQSAVEGLRNPTGSLGIESNLFENKAAYLTSSSTTAGSSILGVSVTNRAEAGSFSLTVEQLATAHKITTDSVDSSTQALEDKVGSFSGTISLGVAGGSTAEIELDGTMTIQDVRSAINAVSSTTGVSATVLTVGDGDVRLVLTAKDTGKAITMASTSGDDALAALGLSADGGTTAKNQIQEAKPAIFTIDGVTLTRTSNTVDDALQGITFSLYKAEPGTTVKVDIEQDLSAVQEAITSMVDAYNELRDFIDKQNTVSSTGSVSADSPLFGTNVLRSVQSTITSIFGGATTGAGSLSLRDLGITLGSDNKLSIDSTKLEQALVANVDTVRSTLEFRFESSSANLQLFSHSGTLGDTEFTVDIVDSDNDGVIESATIDGVEVTVKGNLLIGKEGTAYAGLQLFWSGTGNASVTVKASQGIADKAYEALSNMLDDTEGLLVNETTALEDNNTKMEEDITKINERAETYREQLIAKFAALETALEQSNSLLKQIKAALGQTDDD